MADKKKKATYIVANDYTLVSDGTNTSVPLEPGGRVLLDEDNASHKFLRTQIEAGNPDYEHLQLVEVDHEAEAKNEEQKQELLAKAEKIAAKAREEQAQEELDRQEELAASRAQAEEEGQPAVGQDADFPPQDEEAIRLAAQSGAGQRATTDADVAEEDKQSGSSRRRSGSTRNR